MDLIGPAISTWISDLWCVRRWDQVKDAERIGDAFSDLRLEVSRWPAPKDFKARWDVLMAHEAHEASRFTSASITWDRSKQRSPTAFAHMRFCGEKIGHRFDKWPEWATDEFKAEVESVMKELRAQKAA